MKTTDQLTPQIAVIIETVCQSYSVSYDQLQSRSRKAPLPEARAVCWTVIRHRFFKQTSYKYLGSLFGCCKRSAQKGTAKVESDWWYSDIVTYEEKYCKIVEEVNAKLK